MLHSFANLQLCSNLRFVNYILWIVLLECMKNCFFQLMCCINTVYQLSSSFFHGASIYPIPWPYFRLPLLCGTSWSCISSAGWSQDKSCPRTAAPVWSFECELCVLYRRTCCTPTTLTTLKPCSPPLDDRTIGTMGGKDIKRKKKRKRKKRNK